MIDIAIPVIIVVIIVWARAKKVDPYQSFIKGAKSSVPLVFTVFPYLVAMFIAVEVFRLSGLAEIVCGFLAPVLNTIGIPKELAEFIIIRPFSGNASIILLKDIFTKYGVDSYLGRCASVIMGGSDTLFYVVSIYFSGTNVKKTLLTIPIAIVCSMLASILACLLCRIM